MSQNTKNLLLGRFTSLESDAPDGTTTVEVANDEIDETGAQLDGTAIAEGDLVDAAADEAVITEAQGDTDELLESAESLESFLYAAQLANKEGAGWTRPEATAYAIGIDNVLRPLGLQLSSIGIPSMESFGGARERINSTISVENAITETLKKIWETIKAQINKLVTFVRDWYLKVVEGTARLKKRAEAIKEKASSKSGSPKENKISLALFKSLHVNKAIPTPEALGSALGLVNDQLKVVTSARTSENYGDVLEKSTSAVDVFIDNDAAMTGAGGQALGNIGVARDVPYDATKITNGLNTAALAAMYPAIDPSADYIIGKQSAELPGGKKFVTVSSNLGKESPSDAAGTTEYADKVTVALKSVGLDLRDATDKKVEVENTKDFPTLQPSQVVALADSVIELCDTVIAYKAQYANYEKDIKQYISKMDSVTKKTSKEGGDAGARSAIARKVAGAAAGRIKRQSSAITKVIGYGVLLGRNSLAYANSSLGQYS